MANTESINNDNLDIEQKVIRQTSADGEGRFFRTVMPGIGCYSGKSATFPQILTDRFSKTYDDNYKKLLKRNTAPSQLGCFLVFVMLICLVGFFALDWDSLIPALVCLALIVGLALLGNVFKKSFDSYREEHSRNMDFDNYQNPEFSLPELNSVLARLKDSKRTATGLRKDIISNYIKAFENGGCSTGLMMAPDPEKGSQLHGIYADFCKAFHDLGSCVHIKSHVVTRQNDQSGCSYVDLEPVNFFNAAFGAIQSDFDIPAIEFKDKTTMYFYPEFVIVGTDMFDFKVVSYNDFHVESSITRWHSNDEISDSKVLEYSESNQCNVYKFCALNFSFDDRSYNITVSNYGLGDSFCVALLDLGDIKARDFFKKYSLLFNDAFALFYGISHDKQVLKRVAQVFEESSPETVFNNIKSRFFVDLYRQIKCMGQDPDVETVQYGFLYNCAIRFSSISDTLEYLSILEYRRFTIDVSSLVDWAHKEKTLPENLSLFHIMGYFNIKPAFIEKAVDILHGLLEAYAEYRSPKPELCNKVLLRVANYGKSVAGPSDSGVSADKQNSIDTLLADMELYLRKQTENLRLAAYIYDFDFGQVREWKDFNINYRFFLLAIIDFVFLYRRTGGSLDFKTPSGKILRRVIGSASIDVVSKIMSICNDKWIYVSNFFALADMDINIIKGYQEFQKKLITHVARLDGKISGKEKAVIDFIDNYDPYAGGNAYSQQSVLTSDEMFASLIGLDSVKSQLKAIKDFVTIQKARRDQGLPSADITYHCMFMGNPGTGKTTVARILAKIHKEAGTLSRGHLVEVDRSNLVGEISGSTSIKTNAVIDRAMGGVLFIDEAYSLVRKDDKYGREALDTIIKRMEDDRDRFVVVMAGYPKEMEELLTLNPGLRSRFGNIIEFPDYTTPELIEVFQNYASTAGYTVEESVIKALGPYFDRQRLISRDQFANARDVRNVFEKAVQNQASRIVEDSNAAKNKITMADMAFVVSAESSDSAQLKLDNLIGLQNVKMQIRKLRNFLKIQHLRRENGLPCADVSLHCVFTGNPGTGKTTVARIIADIYRELGVLPVGQLIETDRSGLVAEYLGQTAKKTNDLIDRALGGVLFIDDAYSLCSGGNNDYGTEAVDTLLKRMEDDRGNLVVILSGYPDEMEQMMDMNPGLSSRFGRVMEFSDYSAVELVEIFCRMMSRDNFRPSAETKNRLRGYFDGQLKFAGRSFGNARLARNIYERAIVNHASRIAGISGLSADDLNIIEPSDLGI